MTVEPSAPNPRHDDLLSLARAATPLSSPAEVYFEVTNRCNSLCETCPLTFGPHESAAYLDLDGFKALADQFPDLRRAVLHGIGEPLLNHQLPAMIRHLKDRGCYVLFNSNATMLSRRRQIALIESGLDELRVSIDGSSPETYLRVRGIDKFPLIVRNVAEMVRTKRELGASAPRVSFWVTGLRENLPELPGVIDLAAQIGVEEVYLQRMTYWGEGLAVEDQSIYRAEREQIEGYIAEAERRASQHGISFQGTGALSPRENLLDRPPDAEPWRACSRPLRLAYVTANGNALPCCIAPFTGAPYEDLILGNYVKEGVAAVWQSERYQRFRAQLYSSHPPASCASCGVAWSL